MSGKDGDTSDGDYFFSDHEESGELSRLRLIEQFNDPSTFRYLDEIGVAEGWQCLEIGAGAGSVTRWLAERVGAAGKVVAVDLDTRFLRDISAPNIEVRQCDITQDRIEASSYDLVHARNVVTHLRDPVATLRRTVELLRPGGWLLVEDVDNGPVEASDPAHPLAEAFDRCAQARITFMLAAGIMDLRYGRALPVHVEQLKLTDSGNEAVTTVGRGGSAMSRLMLQSFQPMDDAMISNGMLAQTDASKAQRALEDPEFLYRGGLLVGVWGRRPRNE